MTRLSLLNDPCVRSSIQSKTGCISQSVCSLFSYYYYFIIIVVVSPGMQTLHVVYSPSGRLLPRYRCSRRLSITRCYFVAVVFLRELYRGGSTCTQSSLHKCFRRKLLRNVFGKFICQSHRNSQQNVIAASNPLFLQPLRCISLSYEGIDRFMQSVIQILLLLTTIIGSTYSNY